MRPILPLSINGMVRMVAGFISFVGFPLPTTEKIFSYRLDTAKADEYNRAKEREGKQCTR
jgi:hypothetical protein